MHVIDGRLLGMDAVGLMKVAKTLVVAGGHNFACSTRNDSAVSHFHVRLQGQQDTDGNDALADPFLHVFGGHSIWHLPAAGSCSSTVDSVISWWARKVLPEIEHISKDAYI